MNRRVPVLPTAFVLAAVSVMVALGVWQMFWRAEWKDRLIAHYDSALQQDREVAFPSAGQDTEGALYRRSRVNCARVISRDAIAGRGADGQAGWAQTALCGTGSQEAEIALGWSRDPATTPWEGGEVTGMIAPAAQGIRLVADPPQAGLRALVRPDPHELPNNHRAYGYQWFFFAATALVIYVLALRKRLAGSGAPG